MFRISNRAQTAGTLGMFGAALFFVCLYIEYYNGLFPLGSGTLYVLNQMLFSVAIACILVSLLIGNTDNLLFSLGWLTTMLFGLLAGIAVALNRNWSGRERFALLLQGVYNLLVMVVLSLVLAGSFVVFCVSAQLPISRQYLVDQSAKEQRS